MKTLSVKDRFSMSISAFSLESHLKGSHSSLPDFSSPKLRTISLGAHSLLI